MSRLLDRKLSRRRFLAASAATAAGAYALRWRPSAAQEPQGAVRALVHDARHTGESLAALAGGEPAALRSPFPFTHVGLHWKSAGPAEEAAFELHTSEDGRSWSPWQHVHVEARPAETPRGETYGALVWAPRHRHAQYRASLPAAAAVSSVTATFINTVDGPLVETAGATPTPTGGDAPVTFSREAWGADESLRFNSDSEVWPRMYVPAKKLVVHHTVNRNNYANEREAQAEVRAIYTYHASTLGWGDIAYHVLVDRFGNSYEGRYGRELEGVREVLSPDVVGGHAAAHNFGSTAVALLGTFCSPEECPGGASPSAEMVARLKELLVRLCAAHAIDPQGSGDFLLSNDQWNRGLANICGHRDCNPTICPGAQVYELLGTIREEVAAQLANPSAPVAALTVFPAEETVTTGLAEYGWQAPGSADGLLYSYYLEGWYLPEDRSRLLYLRGFTDDRRPQWSDWVADTAVSFSGLPTGHHSFHLRARDANGVVSAYQESRTLLMATTLPASGDVNCDGATNSVDSLLVLQSNAGLLDSLPCPGSADVNLDGLINPIDATLILQYGAGLLESLPP